MLHGGELAREFVNPHRRRRRQRVGAVEALGTVGGGGERFR
jgi:hypothetical protein